jgi:ribosome biogenesis protein ERB1
LVYNDDRSPLKQDHPQVTWHHKGNYFATVMPTGVSDSVYIHALQRQTSQNPFSKKDREVQKVLFHPTQPILFVAV